MSWKAIGSLLVLLVLSGFSFADSSPTLYRSNNGQPVSLSTLIDECHLALNKSCSVIGPRYSSNEDVYNYLICGDGNIELCIRTAYISAKNKNSACPAGSRLAGDMLTCITDSTPPPNPPNPPVECPSSDVMAVTCSSLSGKHQQSGMVSPRFGPGCDSSGGNSQMQQCGAGCAMKDVTVVMPSGAYQDHVYTGGYCKMDGTPPKDGYQNQPPPNKVCEKNQTYGEINGTPTCVDNVAPGTGDPKNPKPDECPSDSVALISPTTGKPMGCVPSQDPAKDCPADSVKLTVSGITVCVSNKSDKPTQPNQPGQPSGGGGGSTGGKPGSNCKPGDKNCTGDGKGDGTGNGKGGDSSSPDGEKCEYTGLLAFMCKGGPDPFSKDTGGLSNDSGGDISNALDTKDFVFGAGSCPPDVQVNYHMGDYSGTLNLTYAPFCKLAEYIKPVVLALAFLLSTFIIFAGRNK
ncbi:virulence factor TspB C-terminal domain-related protein [Chromobacterium amazonense]|uniref:virulence factor TspB C-terminal domain-related protein n=1 Tax=Chromobacterium amazonense TaxID=1382803 RepID=UPI003F78C276